ncbi:universal stress protein YxiE-like isoform X2 [Saccostrea echinata]|uniref:universal stress protein YxiE-like isoform X2 n=1 Tax=Saccostrea echinata TaxID=191078 RepID=UPI002A801EE5|nr:universal stress protein YxiE-like isoform X2 [Saccostrea echinata]
MAETKDRRTCVIAVDGSNYATEAVKWFKKNVHKPGDCVLLVTAIDHRKHLQYGSVTMTPGNPDSITHAFAAEDKKANELLEKMKTVTDGLGMEAEFVKMSGEAGECIVKKAKDSGADLIVTGCRGLGTIRRTILGSVSDYIIHHSEVPVFVVRH